MFRTSVVHFQERSYAVCCNLVRCYEGEGRTAFLLHSHNNRTYRDIPNCNIQHKNAPEDELLRSETC